MAKKCFVISKANYPVNIQYDGKDLVVAPYGKILLEDTLKVGNLPPKTRKVDVEGGK